MRNSHLISMSNTDEKKTSFLRAFAFSYSQHGVSHEDIIRGRKHQLVKDVTYELASLAHSHLSKVCV